MNVLELTRESIDKGGLDQLVPEFYVQRQAVENSVWHDHDDVYNHVITVFEQLKKLLALNEFNPKAQAVLKAFLAVTVGNHSRQDLLGWAGLLHDIEKPNTIQTDEYGQTKCPGHVELGAKKAKQILDRSKDKLDLLPEDIQYVVDLVAGHDDLHRIVDEMRDLPRTIEALKSYEAERSEVFWPLLFLSLADTRGSQLAQADPAEFEYRTQIFLSILDSAAEWERV